MAIIEKRGDLQWRARVRKRGYPDQSKTFTLKADAERWARETEVEMERGTWRDAKLADASFKDYAERYLRDVTPTKRSSVNETHRIATLLAAPEFRRPLGQIRAVDVATYRDRRLAEPVKKTPKKGAVNPSDAGGNEAEGQAKPRRRRTANPVSAVRTLSPQTVLHELNTLSAIFKHCIKEWSVPLEFNPVRNITLPKRSRPLERRVSELELEWLLRTGAGTYAVPQIITLAVETSMRLGELLGLQWKHVDLQRCTAHLPETKNGYSRTVALSPKAVEALRELKPKKKSAGRLAVVEDVQEKPLPSGAARKQAIAAKQGRVFHWAQADSFEKTWARCRMNARTLYLADCETRKIKPEDDFLVGVRFHTLRHEATSRLFEKGLGLSDVALMTGHRSAQMLMRYTHPDAEKLAERLARLA